MEDSKLLNQPQSGQPMCIHTTWCNQCRVAARHDLAFAFSLPPFLFLFCLFSCSLTQARQYFFFFNIWQKHDKQSISSELGPCGHTIPGCSLSAVIVHSHTYCFAIARTLLKPATLRAVKMYLQPALQENVEMLKEQIKEECATLDSALFRLMVQLSPSFFCTMNIAEDDKKSYLESGLHPSTNSQLYKCVWPVFCQSVRTE